MKIDVNDIRVGYVLEYENKLWYVTKTMHTQPGKGGAYMQIEMKEIVNGTKMNIRLRTDETVVKADLIQDDYQFLYNEGDSLVLMNGETYEQTIIPKALLGDQAPFLTENMIVTLESHDDKVISAKLPDNVEVVIAECEPTVKGQTATASYKPAVLENGVKIMVPQFIKSGDKVVVKIATREYLEKAK